MVSVRLKPLLGTAGHEWEMHPCVPHILATYHDRISNLSNFCYLLEVLVDPQGDEEDARTFSQDGQNIRSFLIRNAILLVLTLSSEIEWL